jgi:Flp pilus assembly protein TadG
MSKGVCTVRRLNSDHGAASVEFVIIFLMLFVPMVFGLFSAGITFNDKLSLAQGVREAARYGATTKYTVGQEAGFLSGVLDAAAGDSYNQISSSTVTYCAGFRTSGGNQWFRTRTVGAGSDVLGALTVGTCADKNGEALTQANSTVLVTAIKPGTVEMIIWPIYNFTMESVSVARYEGQS